MKLSGTFASCGLISKSVLGFLILFVLNDITGIKLYTLMEECFDNT